MEKTKKMEVSKPTKGNDKPTPKEKAKKIEKTEKIEKKTEKKPEKNIEKKPEKKPEKKIEKKIEKKTEKKIVKKSDKKSPKEAVKPSPKIKKIADPNAAQKALDYLTSWVNDRAAWKFQKTRQTWLLKNMFDLKQIPDEKFSQLLQYLKGLRGNARETTLKKSMAVVQEAGKAPEDGDAQKSAQRAKDVIQMYS
ncbi:protein cholesin isoform X2 [Stigmatopora argus]